MSRMNATHASVNATLDRPAPLRLNVPLLDRLMVRRGAVTAQQRASLLDIDRATYFRWLQGQTPDLDTAMRSADRLGVRVDKLWQRDAE